VGEALHRDAIALLTARCDDDRGPLLRGRRRRPSQNGEIDAADDRAFHRLSPGSNHITQSPASGGGGSGLALARPRVTPSSYHGFPDFLVICGVPRMLPVASSVTVTRVWSGWVRKPGGTI